MPPAWRIFLALLFGLAVGLLGAHLGWTTGFAQTIGDLWLDGLRMTIIPLIVALLVTGITRTAESARGGRLALQSVVLFLALLVTVTLIAALLTPALLAAWPLSAESATALGDALGKVAAPVAAPPLGDFLRSIVPTNPIAAAAQDAMLPLILFVSLFAIATTRLEPEPRDRIAGLFGAIEQAMLVIVGWVLWIAPIGVFALAYVVGVRAGSAAIGALAHYIVIVAIVGLVASALAFPIVALATRVRLGHFVRAVAPVQAMALSTQSSLACLPAMLDACERLGIPRDAAGVPLPIAVALFRVTGPAMNLAVAIYVAHWTGVAIGPWTLLAGIAVATLTTISAVSLPGQVSFLTSITPIAVAMGVPIEPLGVLVAVEMLPDLVRTVGNVTMDVATTAALTREERVETSV